MDLQSYIDEFTASPHFLFLSGDLKETAPALLSAFVNGCSARKAAAPENITFTVLDEVLLTHMAKLDVPLAIKQSIPALLCAFSDYLASSGHYPPASAWGDWIRDIDNRYQAKFRDDGSVKGETFKKKYTDVNRNDPCPCGSGKKFKKCCMGIL